jgi:hypothetical protein
MRSAPSWHIASSGSGQSSGGQIWTPIRVNFARRFTLDDPVSRAVEGKPFRAVGLGKAGKLSTVREPFDFARYALDARDFEVVLGDDDLPRALVSGFPAGAHFCRSL